ncbi:MAG TPA: hypothetical protein DIT99_22275, partial [Candidatus Latescibacteria bacterium]|nr:hypothetical protein [Candidatus Latescibacterota bacterium]
YSADIVIQSNDPNKPQVILGDTLTVKNGLDGKISVNPSSLTASLEPDNLVVQTITILNSGAGPLQISNITDDITTPNGDAGWIFASPRFFLVPPGDSTQVKVTFNSASLVSGTTHTANIYIQSTDPTNIRITVTATLKILGPNIAVSPTSFDFRMDKGKIQEKLLAVSNTGDGLLRFSASIQERGGVTVQNIGADAALNKARAMNKYRSARENDTSLPDGSSFPAATSQSRS